MGRRAGLPLVRTGFRLDADVLRFEDAATLEILVGAPMRLRVGVAVLAVTAAEIAAGLQPLEDRCRPGGTRDQSALSTAIGRFS